MVTHCPQCKTTINTETNVTKHCIHCGWTWDLDVGTKRHLINKLWIREETFDYALPQSWCETVEEHTGIWPVPHFVWLYDEKAASFGRPYPLTATGWVVLKMLHVQGAR